MKISTFYIENPAGLAQILKSKPKTIVFKLFHNADQTLSLYAFSGKEDHKDFGKGIKLITDSAQLFHINQECFIGDLQIGNQGQVKDIEVLGEVLKNSIITKIRMKPKVQIFDMPKGYVQSTLTYDFSFWDKDDKPVEPLLALSNPNPCPPYNSIKA